VIRTGTYLLCVLALLFPVRISAGEKLRPNLVLTAASAAEMRANAGRYPLLDSSFASAKAMMESALAGPMDVPLPADAGGYTHERHKKNYVEMQTAGVLYAVTKEDRYARFVRDMLLKYAALYPALGRHPKAAGESAGRLFWQTLNESVWLVHAAQAYDCVYDFLKPEERSVIESQLFRPMARFFTVDHVFEHDRIHNHGTWTVAGVGMLGYALRDTGLVTMALYGTKKDGSGGFIRQLDRLFSPDGYYTEGAYYVRYAILPFVLFAEAIENNQPGLKIFEHRGRVLQKALHAALQLTNTNGAFLPFNDALKEMKFTASEIVAALDIVYSRYNGPEELLSLAGIQGRVLLNGAGLAVARAASSSGVKDFQWKSVELTDGADGTEGAVGILRSGPSNDQTTVLMKYTGHGLSHGHYDKLAIMYYDAGREQLQDYGAVRFINVEPKFGGRYLPETSTWARQTIAHNTVTVDGVSHYGGSITVAEQHHADRHFFDGSDPQLQMMSAKVDNACRDVAMQRTVLLVADSAFPKPIVIDIFRLTGTVEHLFDLPFYYTGQIVGTNVDYRPHDSIRVPLGTSNGYQHLWVEAEGKASGPVQFSWLSGNRYYTITSSADSSTGVVFTRIGAGDPDFNLRSEPGVMLRTRARSHVFASVIEPHGYFEPVSERSSNAIGIVTGVRVIGSTDEATVVEITGRGGLHRTVMVNNGISAPGKERAVTIGGRTYSWTGNASVQH
jgi:hypothetical protein